MHLNKLFIPALAGFFLAAAAAAGPYDDEVEERIGRAGKICVQGQSCGRGGGSAIEQPVSTEPLVLTALEVYQKGCAVCHDAGIGGAPRLGNKDSWSNRLSKSRGQLLQSVLNGQGAMPPRGTCIGCSDQDIENALDYMIDSL